MGVTLEDVALRTNLNIGSVSRILNGKGENYAAATRQRVLDTAVEMGYRPNMLARALGTGRTNTVGIWLIANNYYSPYFSYLQYCLERLGVEHNYQLMIDSVPLVSDEQARGSRLVDWPVDGFICSYMTQTTTDYLHSRFTSPIVYLHQTQLKQAQLRPGTDYVEVDVSSGARQAVTHLLESGCQRIAFMGTSGAYVRDPRALTYRELLRMAVQEPEHIETIGGTRRAGYEAMKTHLSRSSCPDGIFCINDDLAIGCYMALQEQEIRIPDDVLLVGFDGLEDVRFSPTPVSSVTIPVEKMCTLAWELLIERMSDPNLPPRNIKLDTFLEVRASSQLH